MVPCRLLYLLFIVGICLLWAERGESVIMPRLATFLNCEWEDAYEMDFYQYVQFRKRIHHDRITYGLHPLLRSPELDALARAHSSNNYAPRIPLLPVDSLIFTLFQFYRYLLSPPKAQRSNFICFLWSFLLPVCSHRANGRAGLYLRQGDRQ